MPVEELVEDRVDWSNSPVGEESDTGGPTTTQATDVSGPAGTTLSAGTASESSAKVINPFANTDSVDVSMDSGTAHESSAKVFEPFIYASATLAERKGGFRTTQMQNAGNLLTRPGKLITMPHVTLAMVSSKGQVAECIVLEMHFQASSATNRTGPRSACSAARRASITQ
ncbi:hypothetical protein IAT40_001216 [Kwoniella sp. CBS 6097]